MAGTAKGKDTYKATAIFLILLGVLYLFDKTIGFGRVGLPWVMQKDNFILYASVIFLLIKREKSLGIILGALWLILNFGLITGLIGAVSAYMLPIVLLVAGVILYWMSTR